MSGDPYIDNLRSEIESLKRQNLDLSAELLRYKRNHITILKELNRIGVMIGDFDD